MKKKVFGKKLGRSYTAKKALFRSLTRAIAISGGITTTKAKAKAVMPFVEKLIGIAKKGDISSRRRVYGMLANDRKTTDRIFEVAKNFKEQRGGYLKIVNLPLRAGDSAPIVKIEWSKKVESPSTQKEEKKAQKSNKKGREKSDSKSVIQETQRSSRKTRR